MNSTAGLKMSCDDVNGLAGQVTRLGLPRFGGHVSLETIGELVHVQKEKEARPTALQR